MTPFPRTAVAFQTVAILSVLLTTSPPSAAQVAPPTPPAPADYMTFEEVRFSGRQELRDAAPGPQQFDHMIAVAQFSADPKDWLWLDATNELGPAGYLWRPLRDQPALLIDASGGAQLVRTPQKPPFVPRVEVDVKGALQTDGVLRLHLRWTARSDAEGPIRDALRRTPPDKRPEFLAGMLGLATDETKITNVTTSAPSDVSTPFQIECDLEHTPPGRSHDKEWELGVPLPALQLPTPREGVAAGEKAVEFILDELVARAEIELPEGFSARAPLSVSLERPFARFVSEYSLERNRLKLERQLTLPRLSLLGSESAAYTSFREAVEKGPRAGVLDRPAARYFCCGAAGRRLAP